MLKKTYPIMIIVVLLFFIVGCETKVTNVSDSASDSASNISPTINPSDVEWITKTGGLPGRKWKVLFAQRDSDAIKKIIDKINFTNRTSFNPRDYGGGKLGYPVNISIKLKTGDTLTITPLFKVTTKKTENRTESTATAYSDRVLLRIESNSKETQYTLLSDEMARYLLHDSDYDIPVVKNLSIVPDSIKPGEKVNISGDGSTEKEISIYLMDRDSNEKYFIGKVNPNFGSWKWEWSISGRNITTLDSKQVSLQKNMYFFEVIEGSTRQGVGTLDLSTTK